MTIAVVAGLAAGVVVAILSVLVEHSRLAIGPLAFYGNGALIVPGLGAPYAIFAGWTWLSRRGGRALEFALFVVGLHFGVGATSLIEVLFYPSGADLTLLDALPGFVLTGAIFVVPSAVLAGIALWVTDRLSGAAFPLTLGVMLVGAAALDVFYGLGSGLLAGASVSLARRAPSRTPTIATALAPVMLVLSFAPLLSGSGP